MAFMIEGDGSTTIRPTYGTGGNTVGNWITGTPMPIIDNSGIASDYQIRYFPTIFMICPDRIVREVGQLSTVDLEAVRAECSIATQVNDAGITNNMMYLNGTPAGCGNLNINYRLCNYGTDALTSATITLRDGATTIDTYNWTGNLATYESIPWHSTVLTASWAPTPFRSSCRIRTYNPMATRPMMSAACSSRSSTPLCGPAVGETFASASFPPSGWSELNGGDVAGWEYSTAGLNGAGSAKMNFVYSRQAISTRS